MRIPSTGPGVVLDLIRLGIATTRRDLLNRLGWSRVTLERRLGELVDAGLVVVAGARPSRGGRPSEEFEVARDAGLILALEIGGTHTRMGLTDLVSNVLVVEEADIGMYSGPDEVFSWTRQVLDFVFARIGRRPADVRAIGVGVPGPVDVRTGRLGPVQSDHRWAGVDPQAYLRSATFDAVMAVDRDVNMLAVGESRLGWPEFDNLVVVKVGMGVGVGFVLEGRVYRGSRGGAGQLSAPGMPLAVPFRQLETVASGAVVRAALARGGVQVTTSAEIVDLARAGDRTTVQLLDEAGETIGAALAEVVGILNPEAVVVGGSLVEAGERFLGAIRSGILSHGLPLARRGLVIERNRLGERAAVRGASLVAQDALFDVDRVDRLIREGQRLVTNP
ncbi:MAG: ROK family protein [Propionicimonas sp.]|uniref:ROK family protein n=1 Tax=Propionicimonas sp. TaxID=1955623 RepID=UPI002B201A59|nr:ROK family protein [Propionicimonas sp.]MEA4943240.1 ROK family protein [Propionicimonas sp.]MEA5117917.1 ROK family protein [Propionicimonas sp.]